MQKLKDILELLKNSDIDTIYIQDYMNIKKTTYDDIESNYDLNVTNILQIKPYSVKDEEPTFLLNISHPLTKENFEEVYKDRIEWLIDTYIKPLQLENIEIKGLVFDKKGELTTYKISYNIIEDLQNNSSEIYNLIFNEYAKNIDNLYNFDTKIILKILTKWAEYILEKCKEINPNMFSIDIDVDENMYYKVVQEYLDNKYTKTKNIKDIIVNEIYEDFYYVDYYLDLLDNLVNDILDPIRGKLKEVDNITNQLEKYNIRITSDFIINIREIIENNIHIDVSNIDNIESYLNLYPKQNGNDEGTELSQYFSYLYEKNEQNFKPIWLYNDLPKESEIVRFLFNSQGYEVNDLFNEKKRNQSEFLQSFKEELDGIIHDTCIFFTILVKLDNDEIEKLKKNESIIIPKRTTCGLVNIVHGSGSNLDIKLEKDIKLKFDTNKELFQIKNTHNPNEYGYSLFDIYGDIRNLYERIK